MLRTDTKPDRKNAFVNAAEELFNEKGFENTSVDDIAARVGVAKGLFYYYFESKEELLAAIIQRLIEEVRISVKKVISQEGLSAVVRLRGLGEANEEIKSKSIKLIAFFHQDRNKALHYCMEDQMMEFMVPAVEAIIRQGVEEGVFDTPYPRETAIALLSAIRTISHDHLFRDPNDQATLEYTLKYMTERLLGYRAIAPESRGKSSRASSI